MKGRHFFLKLLIKRGHPHRNILMAFSHRVEKPEDKFYFLQVILLKFKECLKAEWKSIRRQLSSQKQSPSQNHSPRGFFLTRLNFLCNFLRTSQTRRRHASRITRIRPANRPLIKPHPTLKLRPRLSSANRKTDTHTTASVNSAHATKRTICVGRAGRIISAGSVLATEANSAGASEAETVAGAGLDAAARCSVAGRVGAATVDADA
jgi:hypothetical protein